MRHVVVIGPKTVILLLYSSLVHVIGQFCGLSQKEWLPIS
jgi:hypothetical protein